MSEAERNNENHRGSYTISYDQLPECGGISRVKNAYDLAVTQNYFDPLCKLMDAFWKQLSDVALIPLTSEQYLDLKKLQPEYTK